MDTDRPLWSEILDFPFESNMALTEVYDDEYPQSIGSKEGNVYFNVTEIIKQDRYQGLVNQLDATPIEISSEIVYMDRMDLINIVPYPTKGRYHIGLTKSGFDVAMSQRNERKQQETNDVVALFTGVLVIVGMIQAIAASLTIDNPISTVGLLLLVLGACIIMMFGMDNPLSDGLQRFKENILGR